jgi:hypothetical protein
MVAATVVSIRLLPIAVFLFFFRGRVGGPLIRSCIDPVFRGSIGPFLFPVINFPVCVVSMSVFSIRPVFTCPLDWFVVRVAVRLVIRFVSTRALSAVVGVLCLGAVALAAGTGEDARCTVVAALSAALHSSTEGPRGVLTHLQSELAHKSCGAHRLV